MAIKLIGIDIDGTLLNSKKELTKGTLEALWSAAERGVEIVIATGRFLSEFPELVEALPMMRYAVTCTGAQVLDLRTGETLARHALTASELRRLYGKLDGLDAMPQIFSEHDGRIHNRASDLLQAERFCGPVLARVIRRTHVPEEDLDRFVADYTGLTNKIHMFFPRQSVKEAALARFSGEPYALMESADNDLELMASGVDKGLGLRELAARLDLDRSQVMAIGDGGNDAAMLRYAGLGVAMGNASPEAKAAADRITASNDEDGAAKAILAALEQEDAPCFIF